MRYWVYMCVGVWVCVCVWARFWVSELIKRTDHKIHGSFLPKEILSKGKESVNILSAFCFDNLWQEQKRQFRFVWNPFSFSSSDSSQSWAKALLWKLLGWTRSVEFSTDRVTISRMWIDLSVQLSIKSIVKFVERRLERKFEWNGYIFWD